MSEPCGDDEAINLESRCFDELDRNATCDEPADLGPVDIPRPEAGTRMPAPVRELTADRFPPEFP